MNGVSARLRYGRTVPWILLAVLVAIELAAVSLLYRHNFDFVCRDAVPAWICATLSRAVPRALALLGVGGMILLAHRAALSALPGHRLTPNVTGVVVQVCGIALLLIPLTFVADAETSAQLAAGMALWLAGGALAVFGTMFAIAPWPTWAAACRVISRPAWGFLGVALFAPEITDQARVIWFIQGLTTATFAALVAVLHVLGIEATADPVRFILRNGDFAIAVGKQCSGVEGFALFLFFASSYLFAFRDGLRFPHVLLLLPIGLAVSWAFNVVRIALLFWIGVNISPDLAVEGFHSHAGWLMFTLLALAMVAASRLVPAFRASRALAVKPPLPPLRQDWAAARILPFAAFMAATLLVSTFFETPALYYWVKALAMAGALAYFAPQLLRLDWRPTLLPIAVGLAIGVAWLVTAEPTGETAQELSNRLALLGAASFSAWVVIRLAGTILLVPLVEELFFRAYVLDRLDTGGIAMRLLALVVSTGLFALLHDRWLIAALAGLAFGLIYLRRRRLADAVWAHACANLVVAAAALATRNWALF